MQKDAWCRHIIEALTAQGVDYFCIAPGSRSAPLVLAAAEHPTLTTLVHFDERGVGFHAVGYGKAAKRPAAIIATSGTAVANLFPAIVEAFHARTPLIVLTADRPPELRARGSNQTIDQVKFFQDYVHYAIDLPCSDGALSSSYLSSTLAHAVYMTSFGPVHINCMIREGHCEQERTPASTVQYSHSLPTLDKASLDMWKNTLSRCKSGAIILGAGAVSSQSALDSIYDLAESLGWPLYADILSGARSYPLRAPLVSHYELLGTPDTILHFGDRVVSKQCAAWIQKCKPSCHILVAVHTEFHDPFHTVTHRVICDPEAFCKGITPLADNPKKTPFSPFPAPQESFSESYLMYLVQKTIPDHYALFIGNSMPIRDADRLFFPNRKTGPIFANRGASGIDGNIATAYGIAQGLKCPVLAILGDQTFLHDMNSLAMQRHLTYPVAFLIYNNQGGAIFSSLPMSTSPFCDAFFTATHPFTFKGIADTFSIPYHTANTLQMFTEQLSLLFSLETTCLFEVATKNAVLAHTSGCERSLLPIA